MNDKENRKWATVCAPFFSEINFVRKYYLVHFIVWHESPFFSSVARPHFRYIICLFYILIITPNFIFSAVELFTKLSVFDEINCLRVCACIVLCTIKIALRDRTQYICIRSVYYCIVLYNILFVLIEVLQFDIGGGSLYTTTTKTRKLFFFLLLNLFASCCATISFSIFHVCIRK